MDIALDIETIPDTAALERLPEPEIALGNLKAPAKIAEKIEKARAEQIESMALSPLYGRVCAGVAIRDDGTICRHCVTEESDEAECGIIESLFEILHGNRAITYNGNGFDLPFLYRRAVLLGIDPREFGMPALAEMTARNSRHHVDVMLAWCGFGKFEKLDNLSRAILGERKNEINFRDFPELIRTQGGREILLDYCEQDVALTMKLWSRISGILV